MEEITDEIMDSLIGAKMFAELVEMMLKYKKLYPHSKYVDGLTGLLGNIITKQCLGIKGKRNESN